MSQSFRIPEVINYSKFNVNLGLTVVSPKYYYLSSDKNHILLGLKITKQ